MAKNPFHSETLTEEAEAWIVRLRSDLVSESDKQSFSRWLNTSPAHMQAFDDAFKVWQVLDAIPHVAALVSEPLDTADHSAQPAGDLRLASPFRAAERQPGSKRAWHFGLGGIAACITFIGLMAITLIRTTPDAVTPTQRFVTKAGEIDTVQLDDGSVVELNTRTVVEVRYQRDSRNITLLQGEAYFSVAKDKNRPFVVNFGKGTATAIGTAFNIYRRDITSSVIVTEGIVDVREPADFVTPDPAPVRVVRDQEISLSHRGMGPVKYVKPRDKLSWRDRTVVFNDTPLSEALAELNRYLDHPVDIARSDISYQNVTGTFRLDNPSATLDALVTAFDLTKQPAADSDALYLIVE